MAKDDAGRGLYQKFKGIERVDGQSEPGRKHYGCEYFVLDLHHDKHAYAAILAYARSCEIELPALARDLRTRAIVMCIGQSAYFDKREPVVVTAEKQQQVDAWVKRAPVSSAPVDRMALAMTEGAEREALEQALDEYIDNQTDNFHGMKPGDDEYAKAAEHLAFLRDLRTKRFGPRSDQE